MSDVALQISMKNYHITTGNGLVRCTSTAKFTAVKVRLLGLFRRGKVTSQRGHIWV